MENKNETKMNGESITVEDVILALDQLPCAPIFEFELEPLSVIDMCYLEVLIAEKNEVTLFNNNLLKSRQPCAYPVDRACEMLSKRGP